MHRSSLNSSKDGQDSSEKEDEIWITNLPYQKGIIDSQVASQTENTNRRNQRPWATSGWKQDVRIQYKEDDLQNDSKRDKISDSGETWNQFWSGSPIGHFGETTRQSIIRWQSSDPIWPQYWWFQGENSNIDKHSLIPDPEELLLSRKEGQHLTPAEKKKLKRLIIEQRIPIKDIKAKYMVSSSTLKRIMTISDRKLDEDSMDYSKMGRKIFKSKKVNKRVSKFVYSQEVPFRSVDVWRYIYQTMELRVTKNQVSDFMKQHLGMPFKRASSKPIKLDTQILYEMQKLFVVLLAEQLERRSWIVNIDECSTSRPTKQSYAWGLKGVPTITKNIMFSGSINLITAITTTGSSYSIIKSKTSNRYSFLNFLTKLFNEMKLKERICSRDIIVILDNAKIHQAHAVVDFMDSEDVRYLFLPQYSPEFAPVEIFFANLKQALLTRKAEMLNLGNENGTEHVGRELQNIEAGRIRRIWGALFIKLKYLLQWLSQEL